MQAEERAAKEDILESVNQLEAAANAAAAADAMNAATSGSVLQEGEGEGEMKKKDKEGKVKIVEPGLIDPKKMQEFKKLSAEELAMQRKLNLVGGVDGGSIRLYFPDMGAAALARRDWKTGTVDSEVPNCIVTANIQNDQLQPSDRLVVLVCPLYSEQDQVKRIIDECAANQVSLRLKGIYFSILWCIKKLWCYLIISIISLA